MSSFQACPRGFLILAVFSFVLGLVVPEECLQESTLDLVAYGDDPEQVMDIFLPFGRHPSVSKVIMLLHGGGWTKDKTKKLEDYTKWFKETFPRNAIVILHYRMGTSESPGFPKQIEDIGLGIQFLKANQAQYGIQPHFGLVGLSSGAHIAMLYAYGYDLAKDVKVVCNIVGLTDLTDPILANTPTYSLTHALVGNYSLKENPEMFSLVSPIVYINSKSPPTISFYGGLDPLVTVSQARILEDKLDSVGVVNKYIRYANEGHRFHYEENKQHLRKRLGYFFKNYLL